MERGKEKEATLAQLVEQLICNQRVGGSSPLGGSLRDKGELPERSNGVDCKSIAYWLRWFESATPHYIFKGCGRSSIGRASAFQAEGCGFETHRPLWARLPL